MADFFAYDSSFRGGVSVAVGDVNGDGLDDLVTGVGAGGGPNVRVFAATTAPLTLTDPPFSATTLPADLTTTHGAVVNLFPTNTFGTLTGPITQVLVYTGINPATPYASFFAADSTYSNGVRVRSVGVGQIATSYGRGFPGVTQFFTSDPATVPTSVPTTFQPRPNSYAAIATSGLVFDPQYTGGLNVASTEFGT